ncbi:MAG: hypothetical protein ACYTGH_16660 [Planctomycetota bacterium]|jgi:2-keto-3-deoxy-6-phosphogluconate aldolase
MSRLFDAYRTFHQQAFTPIFCQDEYDSRKQVEACVAAGCKGIEYTLRKPDAKEMIPWIRKNFPDLFLLVGSTVDSEKIVNHMKRKVPQLMTVAEVADMDVDGFVSMINWTEASIRKYAPTHVLCPTAMTVGEALNMVEWGAHFMKLSGADLSFVKRCRGAAAFDYMPIFVTGGQTPEAIPASFEAGAVMVASGFDLTMKGIAGGEESVEQITEITRTYLDAAQKARAAAWPELAAADQAGREEWLAALPHYHPFG